jgi:three-Cys-motif partner protein
MAKPGIDDIGPWTERKHAIIAAYAERYTEILTHAGRKRPFRHFYIDGYAGAGRAESRQTRKRVLGSPLRVLEIEPSFSHYFFIEKDPIFVKKLSAEMADRADVDVIPGDANEQIPRTLAARVDWKRFERAFILLDPCKLVELRWETIVSVAENEATDLLLYFPTGEAYRNVFRKDPSNALESEAANLEAYLGVDVEEWRTQVYRRDTELTLFGDVETLEKRSSEEVLGWICGRLKSAGFKYTGTPIAMRNTKNVTLYHLIFAVHHQKARDVVNYVTKKFKD